MVGSTRARDGVDYRGAFCAKTIEYKFKTETVSIRPAVPRVSRKTTGIPVKLDRYNKFRFAELRELEIKGCEETIDIKTFRIKVGSESQIVYIPELRTVGQKQSPEAWKEKAEKKCGRKKKIPRCVQTRLRDCGPDMKLNVNLICCF